MGDWGRSTLAITTKYAIPIQSDSVAQKKEAKARQLWMEPECLRFQRKPFTNEKNIYYTRYVTSKI